MESEQTVQDAQLHATRARPCPRCGGDPHLEIRAGLTPVTICKSCRFCVFTDELLPRERILHWNRVVLDWEKRLG
jgi:hypothetical protein